MPNTNPLQQINLSSPDDGLGDPIRDGGVKINYAIEELQDVMGLLDVDETTTQWPLLFGETRATLSEVLTDIENAILPPELLPWAPSESVEAGLTTRITNQFSTFVGEFRTIVANTTRTTGSGVFDATEEAFWDDTGAAPEISSITRVTGAFNGTGYNLDDFNIAANVPVLIANGRTASQEPITVTLFSGTTNTKVTDEKGTRFVTPSIDSIKVRAGELYWVKKSNSGTFNNLVKMVGATNKGYVDTLTTATPAIEVSGRFHSLPAADQTIDLAGIVDPADGEFVEVIYFGGNKTTITGDLGADRELTVLGETAKYEYSSDLVGWVYVGGNGSVSDVNWQFTAGNQTVADDEQWVVTGAHVITAPASPSTGDSFLLAPGNGDWDSLGASLATTDTATVAAGQSNVFAGASAMTVVYDGGADNWVVFAGDSPGLELYGGLLTQVALTALPIANIEDGRAFIVNGSFTYWDSTATSGTYEPDDKANPGVDPGYWVGNIVEALPDPTSLFASPSGFGFSATFQVTRTGKYLGTGSINIDADANDVTVESGILIVNADAADALVAVLPATGRTRDGLSHTLPVQSATVTLTAGVNYRFRGTNANGNVDDVNHIALTLLPLPSVNVVDPALVTPSDNFIRAGRVTSTNPNVEVFTFDTPFDGTDGTVDADILVLANRSTANQTETMPVIAATLTGFTLNRDGPATGNVGVDYIAVNLNALAQTVIDPGLTPVTQDPTSTSTTEVMSAAAVQVSTPTIELVEGSMPAGTTFSLPTSPTTHPVTGQTLVDVQAKMTATQGTESFLAPQTNGVDFRLSFRPATGIAQILGRTNAFANANDYRMIRTYI